MRFLFYDRVDSIEKGSSIRGVKSFALSEEFLRGHFSKVALVPGVIMIEAMAQLLGWLIMYSHDFKLAAIMSLIEDVNFPAQLRPGFTAEIHAEIISTSRRDTLGRAEMYSDGELIASMNRTIYTHFQRISPDELKEKFRYYSGLRDE
jgi:3-hydroxyacyl-[acyl-carrier-protein] dehydratase